jgi:hypothetical protein
MTAEDRLRSVRLEADAGPLRSAVLAAAARARREQRLWRWTWVAAAAVVAVAVPVNLSVDRVGSALANRRPSEALKLLPEVLREVSRPRLAAASRPFPRTVEDVR